MSTENGTTQTQNSTQSASSSIVQSANNAPINISTARLNTKNIPTIVGDGPRARVQELYSLLVSTNIPLYLIGDSGTGKTLTGKTLCKLYVEAIEKRTGRKVPAYYFQLSETDNKTSVLLGLRMWNGSMVPVEGVLAQAAREGGIVFIDEITHSTPNMLLMLNSIDGKDSVIAIGDRAIDASRLKIIYGSNRSDHVGNIRVPQSFANRVIGVPFEYPSWSDEVKISKVTAQSKLHSSITLDVPDSVVKYIASFAMKYRTPEFPISSRNIAHCLILLQFAKKKNNRVQDKYFTTGSNVTSLRQTLAERIFGKTSNNLVDMADPQIVEFINYVSSVGVNEFREKVKMGLGLYIDIDGNKLTGQKHRQTILTSIL